MARRKGAGWGTVIVAILVIGSAKAIWDDPAMMRYVKIGAGVLGGLIALYVGVRLYLRFRPQKKRLCDVCGAVCGAEYYPCGVIIRGKKIETLCKACFKAIEKKHRKEALAELLKDDDPESECADDDDLDDDDLGMDEETK